MTKMLTSHATVYAREAYGVAPFEWAGKCAALERIIQEISGMNITLQQAANGGLEVSGHTGGALGLVKTTVTFKESIVRTLGDRLMSCSWDVDRRVYCRNAALWNSWEHIVRIALGHTESIDVGGSTISEDKEELTTNLPWSGRSACIIRRVSLSVEHTGHIIAFTLIVTTTEPDEEVYFWLQPTADVTLDWGDGTQEVVANDNPDYLYHTYATAGTRILTVSNAAAITVIEIDDYWFSGFNSAQLRDAPITYLYLCGLGTAMPCHIDSADMTGWNPDVFVLYDMPAGSYRLDTADMAGWDTRIWNVSNLPAGEYAFHTADLSLWGPRIGYFRANKLTGITWDITSDAFASWVYCFKCDVSDNGFSTAQVNAVLWGLYRAATIREATYDDGINVGGTNAAPSGTFQAATSCPVTAMTPGKEVAHELLNNGCGGIASGRVWASVIFTP